MKHLTFTITAILAALFIIALPIQAAGKKTARIEFESRIHDFGRIPARGSVTTEFTFKNTGDGNLVITQATSECGCTKPEYPDFPVAPGKEGSIKVTYSPNGHIGHFEKSITVRTNGEPKKVKLKIKGEVER